MTAGPTTTLSRATTRAVPPSVPPPSTEPAGIKVFITNDQRTDHFWREERTMSSSLRFSGVR
jgi:hypothetical protein